VAEGHGDAVFVTEDEDVLLIDSRFSRSPSWAAAPPAANPEKRDRNAREGRTNSASTAYPFLEIRLTIETREHLKPQTLALGGRSQQIRKLWQKTTKSGPRRQHVRGIDSLGIGRT